MSPSDATGRFVAIVMIDLDGLVAPLLSIADRARLVQLPEPPIAAEG